MKKGWVNILVIVLLIVAVGAVLMVKNRGKSAARTKSETGDSVNTIFALPVDDRQRLVSNDTNVTDEKADSATVESPRSVAQGSVLAVVNGVKIDNKYFDERLRNLPAEYQNAFQNDPEGFLEQLIIRELLYQEAKKKGFAKNVNGAKDEEDKKDRAIGGLLNDVAQKVVVSDEEVQNFYEARRADMRGASFQQVKQDIENFLRQQKADSAINGLIEELKNRAKVEKNEWWLATMKAKRPADPLDKALQSGKPTVLDLGAGSCVPCKMMKPIFAELQNEMGDRVNFLILEISEYRHLANRYNVRLIPTQIFFDKDGKIFWRHEGFLSKDDIKKKLKEIGVD